MVSRQENELMTRIEGDAPMGRRSGLDGEDIARIAYGPDAPYWDAVDQAFLRSVDELVADGVISAETWDVLAQHLDPQQLLDLIFTIGAYQTIGWMLRSFDLDFEDDLLPS